MAARPTPDFVSLNPGYACCAKQPADPGRHLPRRRARRRGERPSRRILRPRDLAGEPLQRAGGEPQGGAGYCAIHVGDDGLARDDQEDRRRRFLADAGDGR
jgi:hypothetical protein